MCADDGPRKLDRVAIKVSLQQWLALNLTERRLICEAPVETTQQCLEFAGLIKGLVRMRSANEPATLSIEQQRTAFPPKELPATLALNARTIGFGLSQDQWQWFAEEERYALMKLGGGKRIKRNFAEAMKEFLSLD